MIYMKFTHIYSHNEKRSPKKLRTYQNRLATPNRSYIWSIWSNGRLDPNMYQKNRCTHDPLAENRSRILPHCGLSAFQCLANIGPFRIRNDCPPKSEHFENYSARPATTIDYRLRATSHCAVHELGIVSLKVPWLN